MIIGSVGGGGGVRILPDCHSWQVLQARNTKKKGSNGMIACKLCDLCLFYPPFHCLGLVYIFGHKSEFLPNEVCCKLH